MMKTKTRRRNSTRRFLTFSLDDEVYGIEILYVTEIIGMQSITRVPEVPDYVKGIINLRGKIIPVIDVRLKFGRSPSSTRKGPALSSLILTMYPSA